jgi:TetR/AcrR family tetracycline transcriptional repressor
VPSTRRPGQRAGLTRARVLATAQALLAERGPEALSMRALAERLGVRPNALYGHIGSKTELIDALLDQLLEQVASPPVDVQDPVAGIHELMTSTHDVLLAHPNFVPLYLARQGARGPTAHHLGEAVLALLTRTGITDTRAQEALHVLIVYTIGSAAFATSPLTAPDPVPRPSEDDLRTIFDSGLRWLLAGIAAPSAR